MVVLRNSRKFDAAKQKINYYTSGTYYANLGKSNQEIAALVAQVINHKVLVVQEVVAKMLII
jgi:hypothetical protein